MSRNIRKIELSITGIQKLRKNKVKELDDLQILLFQLPNMMSRITPKLSAYIGE